MKNEKNIPPSLASFAVAERTELLARIEEQTREIERLKRSAQANWNEFAEGMKAQPIGVVLPEPFEMRPFQTVDQGSTNFKAGFNAALRKVRENLNSPPVSAGGKLPDDFVCDSKPLQELLNATVLMLETPNQDSATYWAAQLANVEALLKSASAGVMDERSPVLGGYAAVSLRKDGDLHIVIDATERLANARAQHWREKGYVSNVAPVMIPAARAARPDHSAQSVPDEFAKEVARIADDYHASNIEDADVALDEMREALNSALSMLAAPSPGKQEGDE